MATNEFANMSKSGGDSSIGQAGMSTGAEGGSASGTGEGDVNSWWWGLGGGYAEGTGYASSGAGAVGQNAIGSSGGGVTDNTDIDSINISS